MAGVRFQRHERQHRRGPRVAHAARCRPVPRRQPLPRRPAGLRRHPAAQPALRAPGGGVPALGRRLRLDLAHAQPGARLHRQRRRHGLLLPVRRSRRPLHRAVRLDAAGQGRRRLQRQPLGAPPGRPARHANGNVPCLARGAGRLRAAHDQGRQALLPGAERGLRAGHGRSGGHRRRLPPALAGRRACPHRRRPGPPRRRPRGAVGRRAGGLVFLVGHAARRHLAVDRLRGLLLLGVHRRRGAPPGAHPGDRRARLTDLGARLAAGRDLRPEPPVRDDVLRQSGHHAARQARPGFDTGLRRARRPRPAPRRARGGAHGGLHRVGLCLGGSDRDVRLALPLSPGRSTASRRPGAPRSTAAGTLPTARSC